MCKRRRQLSQYMWLFSHRSTSCLFYMFYYTVIYMQGRNCLCNLVYCDDSTQAGFQASIRYVTELNVAYIINQVCKAFYAIV